MLDRGRSAGQHDGDRQEGSAIRQTRVTKGGLHHPLVGEAARCDRRPAERTHRDVPPGADADGPAASAAPGIPDM